MRRLAAKFVAALIMALAAPLAGHAAYPDHPIDIVVPFPPAGGPDVIARALADAFFTEFKQSAIVLNRDGAGTIIGVNTVAKAPPDGYTMLVSGDAATVNTASGRKLPYDLMADLKPVTILFTSTQFLVVRKDDKRFNTVADLVREAKAHPGSLKFGSSGVGGSLHMSGEIFNSAAQIEAIHVPYRGVVRALSDLAAGHIDYMIAGSSSVIPAIEQGLYRALAVTGSKRSPLMPNVPTLMEQGVNAQAGSWYGLLVPAATPPAIVQQLNTTVTKILKSDEWTERLRTLGGEARPTTPEEATAFMQSEIEKFRTVMQQRGIKIENN